MGETLILMELQWASKSEIFLRSKIETLFGQIATPNVKIPSKLAGYILQLLSINCETAESLFNTFLYYLERHNEVARINLIIVIGRVVISEARSIYPIPYFTNLVKKHIYSVSYGCGKEDSKAREVLHKWISEWIRYRIVFKEFLQALECEERKWTFSKPTPSFHLKQEQSPEVFDLAMLGIIGNGRKQLKLENTTDGSPSSCDQIVHDGVHDGIEGGWMYVDKDGHPKVKIV